MLKFNLLELQELIDKKDINNLTIFMKKNNLILKNNKIVSKDANIDDNIEIYKEQYVFFDQRQFAVKILLNSLYGALLNKFLRFYSENMGQSTTLTGRCIAKHMNAYINEQITGEYDYKGDAIIAADTDSSYFSAYEYFKDKPEFEGVEWTKENVIELYDKIAANTNKTFAEFMHKTFNTSLQRGGIIRAGRELIASSGMFIAKKKYAVLTYIKEDTRVDVDGKPGKLKVMGLDLKRADTPKFMQNFLEKLLIDILTGKETNEMYEDVKVFRSLFKDRPSWEKGSPKKVSDILKYSEIDNENNNVGVFTKKRKGKKVTIPGHVRASINWNRLCEIYEDKFSTAITDGTRIIYCKLKPNSMGMDSIAYPVDQPHLPEWFKELPFDDGAMEETIINKKLTNLVSVLKWDLSETFDRSDDLVFFEEDEKTLMGHNGGPSLDDDGDFDDDDDLYEE